MEYSHQQVVNGKFKRIRTTHSNRNENDDCSAFGQLQMCANICPCISYLSITSFLFSSPYRALCFTVTHRAYESDVLHFYYDRFVLFVYLFGLPNMHKIRPAKAKNSIFNYDAIPRYYTHKHAECIIKFCLFFVCCLKLQYSQKCSRSDFEKFPLAYTLHTHA